MWPQNDKICSRQINSHKPRKKVYGVKCKRDWESWIKWVAGGSYLKVGDYISWLKYISQSHFGFIIQNIQIYNCDFNIM